MDVLSVSLLVSYDADIHALNSLGESALDLITSVIMSSKQPHTQAINILQLLNNTEGDNKGEDKEEEEKEIEYTYTEGEGYKEEREEKEMQYTYEDGHGNDDNNYNYHSNSPALNEYDGLSVALSDFSLQTGN